MTGKERLECLLCSSVLPADYEVDMTNKNLVFIFDIFKTGCWRPPGESAQSFLQSRPFLRSIQVENCLHEPCSFSFLLLVDHETCAIRVMRGHDLISKKDNTKT